MFTLDQQQNTELTNMKVHWKRDFGLSLLGLKIDPAGTR